MDATFITMLVLFIFFPKAIGRQLASIVHAFHDEQRKSCDQRTTKDDFAL